RRRALADILSTVFRFASGLRSSNRMDFEDPEVARLDLTDPEELRDLVVRLLCARHTPSDLDAGQRHLLIQLIDSATANPITYCRFNELLLALNQHRVCEPFFRFFFGDSVVTLDDLKIGVSRFRGFAMLCFGNFRFAYRSLSRIRRSSDLEQALFPYSEASEDRLNEFRARPPCLMPIHRIKRDETWYVGEVTGREIENEIKAVRTFRKDRPDHASDVEKYFDELASQAEAFERVQETALQNTDTYLTWDHLDVYVATSMRNSWEFCDTYDFIDQVFEDNGLRDLKLRFFDPTQSKCDNRHDKGLLEGLMLKRAKCTIYMAQESDTMGKDSELAATLAQSKPVIVYVPRIEIDRYAERIRQYPLEFFYRRLLVLKAEKILNDDECAERLVREIPGYNALVPEFIGDFEQYRQEQPFVLWREKDNTQFKQRKRYFEKLCRLIAIAESRAFDKRAWVLRDMHPLGMQLDLVTGVAVGVLVVRSAADCADLLRALLLNDLQFRIVNDTRRDEVGFTVLKEKRTSSVFRVVTHNEKLTNTFWNFFRLEPRTKIRISDKGEQFDGERRSESEASQQLLVGK
ncbi:MAG: hypothetical protein JW741_04945, partial [Sedimentisphaerales bacterium]|nr:hypothetical protein [Sedimentisphaerales bacterium]